MAVDLQDTDGPVLGQRPQHRQRHRVVAADRDRPDSRPMHLLVEALDQVQRDVLRHRVDRRVTQIGHIAEVVGLGARHRMHQPDQPRGRAHRRRSVAGARAVVQAQIERHADQPDIDLRADLMPGHPHEGRHIREAGHLGRVDRAKRAVQDQITSILAGQITAVGMPQTRRAGGARSSRLRSGRGGTVRSKME